MIANLATWVYLTSERWRKDRHGADHRVMRNKVILLCLLALCLPQTALAYIDPGTGAYLVQGLAALLGAVAFYISHPVELLRRLKEKLTRGRDRQA